MFKGYLHAKCQVPVPMHKENADETLEWVIWGLETDFSANDKVVLREIKGGMVKGVLGCCGSTG